MICTSADTLYTYRHMKAANGLLSHATRCIVAHGIVKSIFDPERLSQRPFYLSSP
jgi:hypothetical protein